jgi:transposase, IS6 family
MDTLLPPFKWRHFEGEIILLCVRWYLRYALSYRDVEELARERGLSVDHTTVFRWVQRYAPELDRRCRPYLCATNDSYRVDETYIKIKKRWYYLYRAQDGTLPETCRLRQCKYLNNMIEQDHRFIKRRVNPGLGFGTFSTAWQTIQGYEAMHMLRKGQVAGIAKGDVLTQNQVINQLFGLVA